MPMTFGGGAPCELGRASREKRGCASRDRAVILGARARDGNAGGREKEDNRRCCQPVARATCFERSVRPPHQFMPHCYVAVRCFKPAATRSSRDISRPLAEAAARETASNCHVRECTHYSSPPPRRVAPATSGRFHSWGHALFTSFREFALACVRARACTCIVPVYLRAAYNIRIILSFFLCESNVHAAITWKKI